MKTIWHYHRHEVHHHQLIVAPQAGCGRKRKPLVPLERIGITSPSLDEHNLVLKRHSSALSLSLSIAQLMWPLIIRSRDDGDDDADEGNDDHGADNGKSNHGDDDDDEMLMVMLMLMALAAMMVMMKVM